MRSLEGQVAIVTGAARGIGFGIAKVLRSEGAHLVIADHDGAEPEDVGWAVCFLASPEAGYITGQTLVIDGGQVLPESS